MPMNREEKAVLRRKRQTVATFLQVTESLLDQATQRQYLDTSAAATVRVRV